MRCLGQINGRSAAESFVAYLLTQDITTQIEAIGEPAPGEQADRWRSGFAMKINCNRGAKRADAVRRQPTRCQIRFRAYDAQVYLGGAREEEAKSGANVRRIDTRRTSGLAGSCSIPPLTLTLLILSIGISLLSSFGAPKPSNEWKRLLKS